MTHDTLRVRFLVTKMGVLNIRSFLVLGVVFLSAKQIAEK